MTLVEGAIEDEPERLQALAALSEVSLVRRDPFEDGTPAVTVHRLVQAAARARSKTNGLAKEKAGYHFHGLGAYSEAVPFLRDALAIYERRLGPEHRDTARTLNNRPHARLPG